MINSTIHPIHQNVPNDPNEPNILPNEPNIPNEPNETCTERLSYLGCIALLLVLTCVFGGGLGWIFGFLLYNIK